MNAPPGNEKGALRHAPTPKLQSKLSAQSRAVNEVFGAAKLCTWSYGRGVCRFQTSSAAFARKLAQRSGAKLVAYAVNGYLRIFQEVIEPWRARKLVTRYVKAANGAFSAPISRQNAQNKTGRVIIAGVST